MKQKLLSDDDLASIRKRCAEATPGPWISYVEGRDHTSGESVIVRGESGSEPDLYVIGATTVDQDFIAHARDDIPLLLDEVERLRKLLTNK
jgi:hypothetical protein